MSDRRKLSTATQVAIYSVVLIVSILFASAIFVYGVSESVFIRNYSAEMRKIFMDSPMGKGFRYGVGRMAIGRGTTEFYVSVDGNVVQNPTGLSSVPDVEGYVKTRIDGSSYLLYGFLNGEEKVILGARMDDLDFFLESLATTLLLSVLVGVVLSIIGGFFLGSRVSKPIKETSRLLKEITLNDLSRRLESDPKTSELAELKKALNIALDRIQDGYTRQEQFSSDIAHEIRSPLTSILGFSRLILRWGSDDPEVVKEAAESISDTATKMMTITESLLFLSRPEIELNETSFNLRELVLEITNSVPADQSAEMKIEIPDIEVRTDRVLLKIIVKILVENALKFGKNGPIEINWSDGTLSVRDHGMGINEDEKERIFNRFYRGDSSRGGEGHGLGLSIASKICKVLKLSIDADNCEDGGAVFKVEGLR
ncbi:MULTISPECIES: HAMP domain-containing sensor histidine kinase [Mesotoga]|uniref:HAMP domain-containing sensor histidine kinase n=1 Tax=Mesotoga TaxID=1184396 RepID=UPI000EF16FAE|nr:MULTISPECIES: HAMP domain-containing sensor histidine kinase [Mesotoga]MCP5460848.1 HAMP domain-containing histidine kinase [Thermotogota bacterium]RLL91971.1 histidine kinase [Mesotoga sp. HF07.pep.5.2.highcov]HNQ70690.1 HAMP domain-containing sensor histidine kinase [Mesotoga prima]HNS75271.1 HAMP domain-containing sensor histidine kinase [Mesotoga prima]HOP37535.1 HAMP domain-containing sensor histidine kinase [Mesotoga prima]